MTSSGYRVGVLLNILQCTGQNPPNKELFVPKVNSA